MFLHERQGFVFLVLHVGRQRAGQRLDIVRKGRRVAGSNAGVDPGEQRVDAKVLGFHCVEHGYLIRPGDLVSQRRPEPLVLSGVMEVQLVLEGRPAGLHGGL